MVVIRLSLEPLARCTASEPSICPLWRTLRDDSMHSSLPRCLLACRRRLPRCTQYITCIILASMARDNGLQDLCKENGQRAHARDALTQCSDWLVASASHLDCLTPVSKSC
jgi:hypothetical protein